MIPVEQTLLGGPSDNPEERGDCLRAAIASVFEYEIDSVPHFVAEEDWLGAMARWVEERGLRVLPVPISVAEGNNMRLTAYPDDGIYWLATVLSPRVVIDGEPGRHSVVMRGNELVWDPHPEREMGHLGYVGTGYWFIAADPAGTFYIPPRADRETKEQFSEDFARLAPEDDLDIEGPVTYAEAEAELLSPEAEAEHHEAVSAIAVEHGFQLSEWRPDISALDALDEACRTEFGGAQAQEEPVVEAEPEPERESELLDPEDILDEPKEPVVSLRCTLGHGQFYAYQSIAEPLCPKCASVLVPINA